MLFWFVVSCILFVACLIVFILVLTLPPKTKTNPPPTPLVDTRPGFPSGIGQSFANSPDGKIELFTESKPFGILLTTDGPIKNAFLFSNLSPDGSPLAVEVKSTARGFTFEVALPTSVVALQVIDQLFDTGIRSVGVYNTQNGSLLYGTTISKTDDVLVNGFRSHALMTTEHVPLLPGVLYALVGVVLPGDRYVTANNIAQPIDSIKMAPFFSTEGQVGFVASNNLALPTNFSSAFQMTSPFASFQVQEKNLLQAVFDVDTQSARFPPKYINGLKVDVMPNVIFATPGFCSSVYNNGNIISQEATLEVIPIPIVLNSWYAIYIADDSPVGTYSPELVASTNAAEIADFPRQRRVGWARSKFLATEFFRSEQEGSGVRRTTIYMEPADEDTLNMTNAVPIPFRLELIPPTTTECQLQITAVFPQPGPLPATFFQLTIESEFERVVATTVLTLIPQQSYQVQTITLPVDSSLIPARITARANWDGAGVPNPTCTFSILQYVEDL